VTKMVRASPSGNRDATFASTRRLLDGQPIGGRRVGIFERAGLILVLAATAAWAQQSDTPIERHIRVGGRDRSFLVDLPPGYATRGPLPVVLNFHGGGGSPAGARTQSGFSTLGARVGAIVVYPAGTGRLSDTRLLTWNNGTCCGYAQQRHIDEVAFVRALLDTLQASYPVDPKRIFATGLSNGGMMAYLVGCQVADRIAAIAVISGELTADCKPQRPVSVMIVHGTADENLPYNGGVGQKALDRHEVRPVSYAVDTWRARDGCSAPPVVTKTGVVTRTVSSPCAKGSVVELYTIDGGGHAWPGGQRMLRLLDAPSTALDATSTAWEFFLAHPMP
jgi:polyhydroxybutyrate depolymerase